MTAKFSCNEVVFHNPFSYDIAAHNM